MCSKGGPDMAAVDSPGGPHVLPQSLGGPHILPRTVWGDHF